MGGAGGWIKWAAAHPEFGPSDLDFFLETDLELDRDSAGQHRQAIGIPLPTCNASDSDPPGAKLHEID
jgi:hypothetical protein